MKVDDDRVTQFLDSLHKHPDAWMDAGVCDVLSMVELYGGGILHCFFSSIVRVRGEVRRLWRMQWKWVVCGCEIDDVFSVSCPSAFLH